LIDPFAFEAAAANDNTRYVNSERLTLLKKIFETVCEIYSIPSSAKAERQALAIRIIVESRSVEDTGKLLESARQAVEGFRIYPSLSLPAYGKKRPINQII
jgi:hypothetical protein